ncbi:MAG: hypothetical protein HY293_21295 [Planctomycetes bacterium]|nr:hypothetical protein [Planctomycetota bacterium]
MSQWLQRKYLVKAVKEIPRLSHGSHVFPDCDYMLMRQEDGTCVQVRLRKAFGWCPGDVVELDDLAIESARC